MYTVKLDGQLMYDTSVEELKIYQAKLNLEVNKTGGFDFTIYPEHPLYNSIKRITSTIEVFQRNRLLFRGRVLDDELDFYNAKNIITEGDLAFFNDSIIRPFEYQGSIVNFLLWVIGQHNSQVEEDKQFVLGDVTVETSTNYINRSSINPMPSWEAITSRLLNTIGGFIIVRRENGVNYIDYLEDSNQYSNQGITLGKNLLDLNNKRRGEGIITALIPYGARLEDEEGAETTERLTIESVNNGLDYIYDEEAVQTYGWIFGTQTWDDVTLPQNLLTRAHEELTKRRNISGSIDLSAVDLSMLDATIDDFGFFEYVKTNSPHHQLDDYMLVSKLSIDLLNPENNKLTLGLDYSTLTDQQVQSGYQIMETNEQVSQVQKSVNIAVESLTKSTVLYFGINDPADSQSLRKDDMWYQFTLEGTTIMKRWNGSDWDELVIEGGTVTNVSADSITTGTFNGELLNIIGIHTKDITGLNSSFIQSLWNAINSSAHLNGERLRFAHSDGTSTEMGINGIQRVTPTDSRNYHYLMSVHAFAYGDSSSNARWIQLPDDFKGKQFEVYLAISDSLNAIDYTRSIQRIVCTIHPNHNIDYVNARVPVIAYKSETLGDGSFPEITNVQGVLIAMY